MKLKYAHIADYAGEGAFGKSIVVGIFDTVTVPPDAPQLQTPPMAIVAVVEADVAEGSEHRFKMQLVDEDGRIVIGPIEGLMNFAAPAPGRPLQARFYVQLGPMPLKRVGDHSFDVFVDGRQLGTLPLYVVQAQRL